MAPRAVARTSPAAFCTRAWLISRIVPTGARAAGAAWLTSSHAALAWAWAASAAAGSGGLIRSAPSQAAVAVRRRPTPSRQRCAAPREAFQNLGGPGRVRDLVEQALVLGEVGEPRLDQRARRLRRAGRGGRIARQQQGGRALHHPGLLLLHPAQRERGGVTPLHHVEELALQVAQAHPAHDRDEGGEDHAHRQYEEDEGLDAEAIEHGGAQASKRVVAMCPEFAVAGSPDSRMRHSR